MWLDFKDYLLAAGKNPIGYKTYSSKRQYWDKELEKLIKNQHQANRLYKMWSTHPNSFPELLQTLWDDYLEKKKMVSVKVKQNTMTQKLKLIM